MRVLGVDPGSRFVGYGCIERTGCKLQAVTHGTLCVAGQGRKSQLALEDRLVSIYEGLVKVILEVKPQIMVIERVFFAKNVLSALKLGHARGVSILAGRIQGLAIEEYSPTEVKRAIVGNGHADKVQVANVVQLLIGKQTFATLDASDALALAICHIQLTQSYRIEGTVPVNYQNPQTTLGRKKKLSLAESVGIKVGNTRKTV